MANEAQEKAEKRVVQEDQGGGEICPRVLSSA
jgi:hypothetical protein